MKTPEAIKEIQKEINRIELEKLGDGSYDCGGNRPFDYIEISEHEVAEKTLELKDKWSELTKNELAVLRSKFKESHINPDVVFQDKLRILRSLLFHVDIAERDAHVASSKVHVDELDEIAERWASENSSTPYNASSAYAFRAGYRAAQNIPKERAMPLLVVEDIAKDYFKRHPSSNNFYSFVAGFNNAQEIMLAPITYEFTEGAGALAKRVSQETLDGITHKSEHFIVDAYARAMIKFYNLFVGSKSVGGWDE